LCNPCKSITITKENPIRRKIGYLNISTATGAMIVNIQATKLLAPNIDVEKSEGKYSTLA